MTQPGEQQSNLPVAALIVTALAAGSFLMLREPLTSLRHKERVASLVPEAMEQSVEARLWQDPVQAVYSDWTRLVAYVADRGQLPPSAILPQTIRSLRDQLARHDKEMTASGHDSPRRLQLMVMTPGGTYADDAEQRRRQRYALVAALTARNYSPKYQDRIGYFLAPGMALRSEVGEKTDAEPLETPDIVDVCTTPANGRWLCPMPARPLIVSYEIFERSTEAGNSGAWDEVLVLWISRRELDRDLLPKTIALAEYLGSSTKNGAETVLLGPDDSGGLRDMYLNGDRSSLFEPEDWCAGADAYPTDARAVLLDWEFRKPAMAPEDRLSNDARGGESDEIREEVHQPDADHPERRCGNERRNALPRLHILSPRSTVPLDILLGEEFEQADWATGNRKILDKLGVASFFTVLARDDVVIANIVRELQARGLDDCREASGLAVVSELDSAYGRKLPEVVQHAIEEVTRCDTHVHHFGYLRGVDGELPPAAGSASASRAGSVDPADKGKDVRSDMLLSTAAPDRAAGVAQTDYVRRLADQIAQRHVDLSEHDQGGFRAIGILGSDVYDKQLILHALRERLPAVTFFTTDLDARLNAPEEYRWTRNLLIGSAFGLTLPEHRFDLHVAPLRDSYQTAFYKAVLLALDIDEFYVSGAMFAQQARPPAPRLFEIGRSGAIDITVCDTDCDSRAGFDGPVGWVRHAGGAADLALRILLLLSPLIGLMLITRMINSRLSEELSKARKDATRRVFRISLVSTLIAAMILWSWDGHELEPWLLAEGVSSVPTLVLHLTALVYSICFVIIVRGRLLQSDEDCGKMLKEVGQASADVRLPWRPFRSTWQEGPWITLWAREIAESHADREPRSAGELWGRYQQLGCFGGRALRTLPPAVLWTVVIALVLSHGANPLLARDLQSLLDLVRLATIFSVLVVVFVCVDALRLGQQLIKALANANLEGWKYGVKNQVEVPTTAVDQWQPIVRLWRKMDLIVTHTELLSPLLALPFVLLFLLILARMTLFDGWVWTPSLIAVYLGFSVYLLVRALLYQREAAGARDSIISQIDLVRIQYAGSEAAVRRAEYAMEEIRRIDHGAFVPWTRHPIVQSILLPTGGVGLLSLFGLIT